MSIIRYLRARGGKSFAFILAAAAAVGLCLACAVFYAAPFSRQSAQSAARTTLAEAARVDLNTAGITELCTLPGMGPAKARAIIEWRAGHGRFASAAEAAGVPGITSADVDNWAGLVYTTGTLF